MTPRRAGSSLARARGTAATTFASLVVRNYRLYFIGQIVSLAGTWMQQVAQALLVLKLTSSGTALGFVVALQMLPTLVLGAWAGVVSDRVSKRRLLVVTQAISAAAALALGVLVATDAVQLWMVYAIALALGLAQAFDNPARQAFVPEMVGADLLANAVSLNSVMVNMARIVGPAIAGVLTATVGLAPCFMVNAGSYLAVIVALLMMRSAELHTVETNGERARLRDGFAYVRATPSVFVPLVLIAVIGTFTYEFPVSLPLLAERTFHNSGAYSTMSVVQGAGAVVGGLYVAARYRGTGSGPAALGYAAGALGVVMLGIAAAPTVGLAFVGITVMGAVSIAFIAIGNTTLQLGSDPKMRGRVMSMWSIAMIGSTTIGGPFVGWLADLFGARFGVAFSGIAAIVAAVATVPALRRLVARPSPPVVTPAAV
jgi:MFS family permease